MEQQPSISPLESLGIGVSVALVIVACCGLAVIFTRGFSRQVSPAENPTTAPAEATISANEIPTPQATHLPATGGNESVDQIVDAAIQNLKQGSFLFAPPNPMRVGESYRVVVRLTKELTPATSFESELPAGSDPELDRVLLGTQMAVKLQGDRPDVFAITPSEAIPHSVASTGYTEWQWDVRPLRTGRYQLEAIVSVRIPIPGQSDPETIDYDTLHHQIVIDVNPLYSTGKLLHDY